MSGITVRADETGLTFGLAEFIEIVTRFALAEIAASPDATQLERVRCVYLGRHGIITQLLRSIGRNTREV